MTIKDLWPPIMQELEEFQKIAGIEELYFDQLKQEIENIVDDQFIQTATEKGIARREKMLKVVPFADDTLETRRHRILLKYMDRLPYTYKRLLQYLSSVSSNFNVTLNNDAYELFIQIVLAGYSQRDALAAVLGRMIPANLVLKMQTQIPQAISRPALAVCSATTSINKHEHIPQGG